jgi:hypothetical protein
MIGNWYKPTLKLLNSKKLRNEPRYRNYEVQKECLLVRVSIISYDLFLLSLFVNIRLINLFILYICFVLTLRKKKLKTCPLKEIIA